MGASASTSVSDIANSVQTSITGKCNATTHTNQTISGINIALQNYGCPIEFTNQATADSKCQVEQLAETLADLANKGQTQAVAGLGISVSTDVTKTRNDVVNAINAHCNSQANIDQKIKDVTIAIANSPGDKCSPLKFLNSADPKVACALGMVSQARAATNNDQTTTAEGLNLGNFLGLGKWGMVIVIVLVLCSLSGGGYMYARKQGYVGSVGDETGLTPLRSVSELGEIKKGVGQGAGPTDVSTPSTTQTGGATGCEMVTYILMGVIAFLCLKKLANS